MANKKTIYDNRSNGFDEWKEDYLAEMCEDEEPLTEDELWQIYNEELSIWADDERANLNKKLDGVIIAFADLGFWNGRTTGARKFNSNLNSIINTCGCDYIDLYCDRYNVKSNLYHHDGTHYLTYRLAPYNKVNEIMERAERGILTLEYVNKHTKSIRKYVAEIFGW